MDHKTTGLETSWRDGRNRVEIRDVIKTPAKCKQTAIAGFLSSEEKHLAVKIFSMEIAESFEEWELRSTRAQLSTRH